MSMGSEFKEFIAKGNVMDLAVGVIIGAAFGKIVDSVVNDLIMPVVGMATGGMDFSNMFVVLKAPAGVDVATVTSLAKAKELGVNTLNYGQFITIVLNFLILAFIIFMMVKQVNRLKKPEAPAPAAGPTQEELLTEIRDLLKAK